MKDTKLKVWLVNQYAVPTSMPGITRHFELINEWTKENDVDVTVWLSHFNYSIRRFLSKRELSEIKVQNPGIEINWTWSFPHKINNWKRIINMITFSFMFFVKAFLKSKPDVIVASSPQLFSTYAALLISRIFRIPFVLEVRDLWPGSLIAMGGIKPGIILNLLYYIEKELYFKSDKIVILSAHQADYIQAKGIDKSKITLVPNGIVLGDWTPTAKSVIKEIRNSLGIKESDFVAMYTGAHGTANALTQIISAGEFLNADEFIVLIGDGPEKPKLVALKEDKKYEQIIFMDPVPKNEILNYTSIADCGLISLEDNPIFRGARPNKLFDYMFLGMPIVSTIGGEIADILIDNNVGLCAQSNNPKDLVAKLRQIRALNQVELAQIKESGSKYILDHGSRQKSAKIFINLIVETAKI